MRRSVLFMMCALVASHVEAQELEPGCAAVGDQKLCPGWSVTVSAAKRDGTIGAPVGRFVPTQPGHLLLGMHETFFPYKGNLINYAGQGFLVAKDAGVYSFTLQLEGSDIRLCSAHLSVAGETRVSVDSYAGAAGAWTLQPGLWPIEFSYTCGVAGSIEKSLGLQIRLLSPQDDAPHPLRTGPAFYDNDIVRSSR